MSELYMLRRSDNGLLQIGRGGDAVARAEQLSEGHAFDVTVAAVLPLLGHRLENVEWHLGSPPLKGNWHECTLSLALSAVAAALDDEGGSAVPAEALESEPSRLEEYLEPCSNTEATKASDVVTALNARMERSEVQEMLRGLRQVSLPDAVGHKRRVWKDGEGRALRLRA